MNTVIGVGFSFPSKEDDFIKFDTKGSLSDADIVVIDPSFAEGTINILGYPCESYLGKPCFSVDSSFRIRDLSNHWKSEITNFLKAGKTAIVLLSEKKDFYIHTGQKNTSGTGRNQKTTNIVELFDNYRFLPSTKLSVNTASGSKIYPQSQIAKNLYESCKDFLRFQSYIEAPVVQKELLFATKSRDKNLGMFMRIFDGNLLLIPAIVFPNSFWTNNGNWTKEALNFGLRLKSCLVEISTALKSNIEKTPTPVWVESKEFILDNAIETRSIIESGKNKIRQLEQEIACLNEVLKEQESLKDLLFETGKPLELAVIKALKLLGYEAESYNDGILELDQIIISPEGDRFIGECEGKDNKDIDISKFRQLLDALNEDFAKDEVNDKALGILFGNPQRLISPESRSLDFTDKCKRAAERERVALIRTSDLFHVAKYLSESNDDEYKLLCRNAIKMQLGGVVRFPQIHTKVTETLNISQQPIE